MGRGALIALCLGLCLALAAPVSAQQLPATYSVSGVAANDVLNIRAAPSADAPVLGSFDPFRINIEVLALSDDGRWGMVPLPEGNGWVAMRFLDLQPATAGLPRPFVCGGTEPFWTVGLYPGGDEYVTPEGRQDLALIAENVAADGYMATLSGEDGTEWTMLVDREMCSDGMSDRVFGWKTLIFRAGMSENTLLSGCCTMDGA